ncbi:MAG: sulfite exporter TauE/SafE family protein [Bacteroidota bacterium]
MSVDTLFLAFGGIAAGTFGALLGLGGGVFLIPFLVLVLQVPMHQAIATSIVAVIATSSTGAAMNLERHMVNIRLGMLLETTTVAGAIAGGLTASMLDADVLTKIFGVLLIGIAAMMALSGKMSAMVPATGGKKEVLAGEYHDDATHANVLYSVRNVGPTMVISLLAGNVSGLLGLGGGIFKVPAMHLLSGIPLKAATATSNFMIGVTAAAGAFIYFAEGHLDPHIAAPTALGVLLGSFFGIRLGRIMKASILKWVFIVVLIAASIQLIAR